MGTLAYPLSRQIADTAAVHGAAWTRWHYVTNPKGPKMPVWQYNILGRAA